MPCARRPVTRAATWLRGRTDRADGHRVFRGGHGHAGTAASRPCPPRTIWLGKLRHIGFRRAIPTTSRFSRNPCRCSTAGTTDPPRAGYSAQVPVFLVTELRDGPEWDPALPLREQSGFAEHAVFMD